MSLKDAMFSWNAEVEAETTRLIEEGIDLFDAINQARHIVSRRRSPQNTPDTMDEPTQQSRPAQHPHELPPCR